MRNVSFRCSSNTANFSKSVIVLQLEPVQRVVQRKNRCGVFIAEDTEGKPTCGGGEGLHQSQQCLIHCTRAWVFHAFQSVWEQ